MDENLYPKVADFGLSKCNSYLTESMNKQSGKGPKGTPLYMAPEIISDSTYSEASDVYAFSLIVYEIFHYERPFKNLNFYQIQTKVCDSDRPVITDDVPIAYKQLIERCWDQDPKNRPTFNQIVNNLKTNNGFITELVDIDAFFNYCNYIDNYQSTFDSKQTINFTNFKNTIEKAKTSNDEIKKDEIDIYPLDDFKKT